MSDTEQDPLTSRLAYLAGTMDDDDRPTLSDMLKTARAYLAHTSPATHWPNHCSMTWCLASPSIYGRRRTRATASSA